MSSELSLRPARKSDAGEIAILANIASHGLVGGIWANGKDAEKTYSPMEVGRLSVLRETDDLSWQKAAMAELDGEVVGLLLGGPESSLAGPAPADAPPYTLPFFGLVSEAPKSWYISMLAVHLAARGRGVGSRLLQLAAEKARQAAAQGLSLIVEDANTAARRLYETAGFVNRSRAPVVPFPGGGPNASEWLLMVKD